MTVEQKCRFLYYGRIRVIREKISTTIGDGVITYSFNILVRHLNSVILTSFGLFHLKGRFAYFADRGKVRAIAA